MQVFQQQNKIFVRVHFFLSKKMPQIKQSIDIPSYRWVKKNKQITDFTLMNITWAEAGNGQLKKNMTQHLTEIRALIKRDADILHCTVRLTKIDPF